MSFGVVPVVIGTGRNPGSLSSRASTSYESTFVVQEFDVEIGSERFQVATVYPTFSQRP